MRVLRQVPGAYLPWSSPSTWPDGVVPTGGDVVIGNTMNVLLDISPPKLGVLRVEGGLKFDNRTANVNLTLQVDSIVVFGVLEIGTVSQPFLGNATIQLHGVLSSPTVVVDNAYFLGNKLIAVFGNVSMVGKPRNTTWSRLASTASAGSSSITVSQLVDWSIGDEVVVSSTEYDANQMETAIVTGVTYVTASNTTVVTLNRALGYTHLCTVVSVAGWQGNNASLGQAGGYGSGGGNGVVPLCGVVGVLNRNVRLMGADVNASTPNYGGHIMVGDLVRGPAYGGGHVVGKLYLSSVQLHNFGKFETEHPGVTVRYQTLSADNPMNVLDGVTFSYSLNYGFMGVNAKRVNITRCVFHRTYLSSIDLDETVSGCDLLLL